MFSIVIPLYNKELSIKKTIQSVLNQTFNNFEIIIVNDGSTDHSLEVVHTIIDPRIKIINQENGGVSAARNKGINEAVFDWICFLDADDLWKIDHLETTFEMIRVFPHDSVFCTSFLRSNQNYEVSPDNKITIIEDYFKEAIEYHFFWTSVTCLNIKVFKKVGFFLNEFSRGEDIELWARIGREGFRFIRSNHITGIYNVNTENKITHSKFKYSASSLCSIHKRIDFFKSNSEKRYFLKFTYNSAMVFLRRFDIISCIKTLKRASLLFIKPIKNDK